MRHPNTHFEVLPLIMGSLFLCQCQCRSVHEASTGGAANNPQLFVQVMLDDVERSAPWKERPPSHAEPASCDVINTWLSCLEFDKRTDHPKALLLRARNGDSLALAKLGSYVMQHNPHWGYRFEVERMQALRRGVKGVTRYYGETKEARRALEDRRLIEEAVRQMEKRAESDSLACAVALYQFCGSLNETGESLPWGGNEELSAKWLERVYQLAGKKAFAAIVSDEVARMGLVQAEFRTGKYYPHTPPGWTPQ